MCFYSFTGSEGPEEKLISQCFLVSLELRSKHGLQDSAPPNLSSRAGAQLDASCSGAKGAGAAKCGRAAGTLALELGISLQRDQGVSIFQLLTIGMKADKGHAFAKVGSDQWCGSQPSAWVFAQESRSRRLSSVFLLAGAL